MTELNWSRGFFRLWIVGTVVWLIYCAPEFVAFYNRHEELRRSYDSIEPLTFSDWWPGLVFVVLVPPVVLAVAAALRLVVRWVLSGFRQTAR